MSTTPSLFPSLIETLRAIDWPEIATAGGDTLLMLGGSLLFTALLGLPLGIALYLFDRWRLAPVGPGEGSGQRMLLTSIAKVEQKFVRVSVGGGTEA